MIIGLDIDEVLGEFLETFCMYHNREYETSLEKKDFFSYLLESVMDISSQEASSKINEFYDTPEFRNLPLVTGALEGVQSLKRQGHYLVGVTSRPDHMAGLTRSWIETNFPSLFGGIYHTDHHSENGGDRTKATVCLDLKVDIMIEDVPEYCTECVEASIEVILLDKPWNQNSNGIPRAYHWGDILGLIYQKPYKG
jgi:uncharacterized HAD superfamily protein